MPTPKLPNIAKWFAWVLLCSTQAAQQLPAQSHEVPLDGPWRYTTQPPSEGWEAPDFDDAAWQEGPGGFGTRSTPNSRVGTRWNGREIWLRKSFALPQMPTRPALLLHHDEDLVVFLNGQKVLEAPGFTTDYRVIPLDDSAAEALRKGQNSLAAHCRQTGGGQFVDVHVVDADDVPQLPTPPRPPRPFISDLITPWGASVTAENAWTEYPRPSLRRSDWQSLNGHWDYAIRPLKAPEPTEWDGKILVPYPLESKLSGVQKLLDEDEALWYHRTFRIENAGGADDANARTLLHFEAVDYRCQIWVNDQLVGMHIGGNVPFSVDVTKALRDGENTLQLRVEDATEAAQLNGKQSLDPRGIWYTQVSGIWQTVWLERVADRSIAELDIETSARDGRITIRPTLRGEAKQGDLLRITVRDGEEVVATTCAVPTAGDLVLPLEITNAKLWSPSSPHLYDLELEYVDASGERIDRVLSYAGIRDVGKVKDADGNWRFTLNGEILFHWGPLDQGWWPDGLLTPPSDEAMLFDIEFLQAAGFNMIRKHIKVEPRRYYYHCDRLGMLVWQDQVSGGPRPPWTRLAPNPTDAQWSAQDHAQFMREFEWMVDELEFHPSIVVWTPFNEAWGQHRTMEVGRWIAERDPTRIVNIASGGNFWPVGDVVDHHNYPHPDFPFAPRRFAEYIKVVGEFGGHGLPIPGHLWDSQRDNWGYGGLPRNAAEYRERYVESLRRLEKLQQQGIAAGVYTQTTDVEGEINGLLTYDRQRIKIPAAELRRLHQPLLEFQPPAPQSPPAEEPKP